MKGKIKVLFILVIAVALLWGSGYLFLPDTVAQKSSDQPAVSRGAYFYTPVAAKPDKVEGYKPTRYAPRVGVKKQEGGETCDDAYSISSLPFYATGYTCDNVDDYDEACPYTSTSPDVVYSYTPGSDQTINIDLYGSYYDTKVYVYEDACVPPYYACNDDYYPDYTSAIMGLDIYAGHTYYIVIDGYGGNCGDYVLAIEEYTPCDVVCPPGGIAEQEPICEENWEDIWNGGCNSSPYVFEDVNCGDTICGTSGTYLYYGSNYRDTDWFRVVLTTPATLSWKAVGEFPILIFIIDAGSENCVDYTILGNTTANPCDTAFLSFDVPAGVYWLWVGPSVFEGIDCGVEYVGIVGCEVATTGACCNDFEPYDCQMLTPEECAALPDHTFLGVGISCGPPNPCLPAPPNDDCENAIEIFPPDCPDVQTVSGTTIGATIDCPGVLDWDAVWYKFDLPYTSNNLLIDYCPTNSPDVYTRGVVLYDECPPDCPNYILYTGYQWVTCPSGYTDLTVWWNNLPAGTYWLPVYVHDWDDNPMDFAFDICVEESPGPGPGDNCDNPLTVELPAELDYSDIGQTTCGRIDDYDNTCLGSYDGGEDIIYELTVTSAVDVDVTLDPKSTTWTGIALDDACPLDPSTCLYKSTSSSAVPHGFTGVHLEPGTYYIMVDTWPSPDCIPEFDLFITASTPPQPGDNCSLPIEINLPAELPYMDREQTTCGRNDDYENTCLGYYDGGEDIIYQLNVTDPIYVLVTLDPKGTTWTGIALDDACPPGDPCMYYSTTSGSSPHGFEADLAPGTYYIMIDTWPSPDCIPDFDLTIDPLGPEISVSPDSFFQVLNPDVTVDDYLFISNVGYMDLDYQVSEDPEVGWLSLSPTSGTVPISQTDTVTVSFDATGLGVGDYYTTLVVASNSVKQLTDTVLVPVHLVVELPPDIDVVPPEVSMGVIPDCSMDRPIRVYNYGPGELRFEVSVAGSPPLLSGASGDNERILNQIRMNNEESERMQPKAKDATLKSVPKELKNSSRIPSRGEQVLAGAGGFTIRSGDTLIEEGFEVAVPPDGWGWVQGPGVQGGSSPAYWHQDCNGWYAHSGMCGALVGWGYTIDTWLITPTLSLGGESSLRFWWESSYYWHVDPYDNGDLFVKVSTDGGTNWDILWTFGDSAMVVNSGAPWPWENWVMYESYIDLTGYKGDVLVAFNVVADDNADVAIDDVLIETTGPACPVTVSPDAGTVAPGDYSELTLTFDGTDFEQCVDETITCYLVFDSNDPDEPTVGVPVDMWSGRGDVFDPWCLLDLGDVVFLVNFVYRGGPAPDPVCMGDCNPPHDGVVDVEDVMYLIQYLYEGGMPPLAEPKIPQPGTIR